MDARVRRAIDVGLIAATCCMSMPTAGFGQERVRVTLPGETIVGVVKQLSPDALELVLPGGGSRVLSRDEVLRMERGFLRNRQHSGYLLGSAVGLGAGTATWFALSGDESSGGSWILAQTLGLVAGGIAGSWFGASRKGEAWETVRGWTGEPVRVTLAGSERIVGVVSRITREGLELAVPGGLRSVATGDVARIERRTVRRQWKRGFAVGASAGGAVGLLMARFFVSDDRSTGEEVALGLLVASSYVGSFGFLGATVGGLFKREGWEPVQDWPRNAVTPRLLAGMHTLPDGSSGFLLGARLRF